MKRFVAVIRLLVVITVWVLVLTIGLTWLADQLPASIGPVLFPLSYVIASACAVVSGVAAFWSMRNTFVRHVNATYVPLSPSRTTRAAPYRTVYSRRTSRKAAGKQFLATLAWSIVVLGIADLACSRLLPDKSSPTKEES